MKYEKSLTLAVDLYGCPNRCLHCWLGHMPNRRLPDGTDEWLVGLFRPYFARITFFSWLREPDFCPDYRARWERDKLLSVNAVPPRFELASFQRLARDPDYAVFLRQLGVRCVQLSFFGMEATTDRYVGRRGAFRELLGATEALLAQGISPRWQGFVNEENKDELPRLLRLSEELELPKRCEAFGGSFRFFVHEGSCDGENRRLYPLRIRKDHIPRELVPFYLGYDALRTERELCAAWADSDARVSLHSGEELVLYVANNYDLYFNFTHLRPEWRIGSLKEDPIAELVRRAVEEDTPALREARAIPIGALTRRYGDPRSEKAFSEEDFRMYLLNEHLARGQAIGSRQ